MLTEEEVVECIKTGGAARLETLLNEQPELADGVTQQGLSYLTLAAYYRNAEVLELIKKQKSSLDIYEACCLGDLEIAKMRLHANNALINSYSVDGFTPFGLACFFGHLKLAEYLIQAGADVNKVSNNAFKVAPIHSACAISNYEITELLIRNGANVNVKQASEVTPLHSAAHSGQTRLAQLLLDNGADINTRTDAGQTPLKIAEEKSFTETVDFLRGRGGK
jgi:ankyrin repeat protein